LLVRLTTPTNLITVIVGSQTVKVDTRDPRLREDDFRHHVTELVAAHINMRIRNDAMCVLRAAEKIGQIEHCPRQSSAPEPRLLKIEWLIVVFPDGHSVKVDHRHPVIFDLLSFTEIVEGPTITIHLAANEKTAAWYGRVAVLPYQPPVETEPQTNDTPADNGKDSEPAPANSAAAIDIEAILNPSAEPPSPTLGLSAEKVENLIKRVDDLGLSVRADNCLQNAGCEYLFQAVERIHLGVDGKRPTGSLAWPANFGRATYNEFSRIVRELGLQTGMCFSIEQRAALLLLARERTA
jgi:hypothetical protein